MIFLRKLFFDRLVFSDKFLKMQRKSGSANFAQTPATLHAEQTRNVLRQENANFWK